MIDPQKWKLALARFNGYYANIPSFIKTEHVADYHAIVAALEEASAEDLSHFKIPSDKLKPKLVSVRPASYGGHPGSSQYSKDNYCDSTFFKGQIDGLKHYLATMQTDTRKRSKYDDLSDYDLEDLMITRRIKPELVVEDGRPVYKANREYIIAALMKQDTPSSRVHSTTYNVYDSTFIHSSPGASITENIGLQKEEFANLVDGIRQLLQSVPYDQPIKEQIRIDIGTIELQINSSRPNSSIVRESLRSLKGILENTAGSMLASGLLPVVVHLLSKL